MVDNGLINNSWYWLAMRRCYVAIYTWWAMWSNIDVREWFRLVEIGWLWLIHWSGVVSSIYSLCLSKLWFNYAGWCIIKIHAFCDDLAIINHFVVFWICWFWFTKTLVWVPSSQLKMVDLTFVASALCSYVLALAIFGVFNNLMAPSQTQLRVPAVAGRCSQCFAITNLNKHGDEVIWSFTHHWTMVFWVIWPFKHHKTS